MTIRVSGINHVYFKGAEGGIQPTNAQNSDKQIKDLGYVTPDFGVKVPVKYSQLSVDELSNGLKIHSYKLSNGYKVSIVPMEGSPAVVKTYVNVGSMNETPDIKGISHFLEHMAFNGTNGEDGHIKLETGDSFKKIDALGGWANASTNYALTDYVNSAPLLEKNDIETQIKVLGAMTEDLKLSDAMIEKEKGPVCSEINMIMDDAKTIAIDQTVRTLFNVKNPADELVGGSVKHIQSLTRKDVMDYYNKHYYPENINIVVTGEVNPEEVIEHISKNFVSTKKKQGPAYEEKLTPIEKTKRKDFISDKTKSAEIVVGFIGARNNNINDRVLFDVASSYLSSQEVGLGKKLKEYNANFGLDDERITTNPNGNRMIYIGATSSEENSENVMKTIFKTIDSIKPISYEQLQRIKDTIKEDRENAMEYSDDINAMVGNANLNGSIDYLLSYNNVLDAITPEDVNEAVKRYFNIDKAALTVVHPAKNSEVSFKGSQRKPINEDKVTCQTLNNNVELGFYSTKSDKHSVNVNLVTDIPYNKKAGVREILSEIYTMGTANLSEDEFNAKTEKLNLEFYTYAGADGIRVGINGNKKNYKEGLKLIYDIIYNPRINEETLQKAKDRVKEGLMRSEVTAGSLYYNEFYSKYDEYAFSEKEKLDAIDTITVKDVKDFQNYVLKNSRGIVTANLPESDEENTKNSILSFASSIKPVNPNYIQTKDFYKEVKNPVVLTSAQNNSQADIRLTYNFKYDDSPKNKVISVLMDSILSNSSIGLFDILREKEHLAYSVYSNISTSDDLGIMQLNISTTTDNKDIGEQNYENIQRSIVGFHRQIDKLVNGEFNEEDLENAKRSFKAQLLYNEGTMSKVCSLERGINSKYGMNYSNKLYDEIDGITKDDITSFAKKVFSGHPVYAITATQDTLDANKAFLDSLNK